MARSSAIKTHTILQVLKDFVTMMCLPIVTFDLDLELITESNHGQRTICTSCKSLVETTAQNVTIYKKE